MPSVCELLAREWNLAENEVTKKGGNSYILTGRTKSGQPQPAAGTVSAEEGSDAAGGNRETERNGGAAK